MQTADSTHHDLSEDHNRAELHVEGTFLAYEGYICLTRFTRYVADEDGSAGASTCGRAAAARADCNVRPSL